MEALGIQWAPEKRKLVDLKDWERNPRVITGEALERLKKRIIARGFHDVVKIDTTGTILSGTQRRKVLADMGVLEVWTMVPDRALTDEEREKVVLESNRNDGEWDWGLLKTFDLPTLIDVGFTKLEIGTALYSKSEGGPSLADKFIVPPISTLDTKQKYWIDRKKEWLDLGIESELGRGEGLMMSSNINRGSQGRSGAIGTSVFDPVLCEIIYRWFCPLSGVVLDPFAGGSVRGIVASKLGLDYQGIDLSSQQIQANQEQAQNILDETKNKIPTWLAGDSFEVDTIFPNLGADLVFSCPPYFDLEEYSDDPRDLSVKGWEDFLIAYKGIIQKATAKLRPNRFACFVVGEVRNDKNGANRNFVGETINAFTEAGLSYYNEAILLNHYGSAPIRAANSFNNSRKMVKVHQNVLVFFKGNPKEIPGIFPALDFSNVEVG